jgi:hypothetical protein
MTKSRQLLENFVGCLFVTVLISLVHHFSIIQLHSLSAMKVWELGIGTSEYMWKLNRCARGDNCLLTRALSTLQLDNTYLWEHGPGKAQ